MQILDPRPGEQPLPTKGKQDVARAAQAFVRSMVGAFASYESAEEICTELERRVVKYGVKKYGHRLETGNGRDMLKDALDEVLDGFNYSTGDVLEHPDDVDAVRIRWSFACLAFDIMELRKSREDNSIQ